MAHTIGHGHRPLEVRNDPVTTVNDPDGWSGSSGQKGCRLLRIWHLICHTTGMRTTLDIDGDLLAALLDRHPGSSKTEAIEAALRAYLADDAVSRLRRLAGTLDVDDVSATTRAHDRRS